MKNGKTLLKFIWCLTSGRKFRWEERYVLKSGSTNKDLRGMNLKYEVG